MDLEKISVPAHCLRTYPLHSTCFMTALVCVEEDPTGPREGRCNSTLQSAQVQGIYYLLNSVYAY